MFKGRIFEMSILILTLVSSAFTVVNVFMDWVPDIYALATMIFFLAVDALWRHKYDNKA